MRAFNAAESRLPVQLRGIHYLPLVIQVEGGLGGPCISMVRTNACRRQGPANSQVLSNSRCTWSVEKHLSEAYYKLSFTDTYLAPLKPLRWLGIRYVNATETLRRCETIPAFHPCTNGSDQTCAPRSRSDRFFRKTTLHSSASSGRGLVTVGFRGFSPESSSPACEPGARSISASSGYRP